MMPGNYLDLMLCQLHIDLSKKDFNCKVVCWTKWKLIVPQSLLLSIQIVLDNLAW